MTENTKKTFATVFAYLENVHLIKDPGMIPYTMQHEYGYKSILPCSGQYTYDYAKDWYDVEMPVIDDSNVFGRFGRLYKRHKWIKNNACSIDVLHLFFYSNRTLTDIAAYQKLNPYGKVYVHCDWSSRSLIEYGKNSIIKKKINQSLLKRIDTDRILWGIQDEEFLDELRGKSQFKHIEYIPDGYFWQDEIEAQTLKKENVIITVSNLGTAAKRTDVLLEGFKLAAKEIPDWNLKLIGPLAQEFKPYIDNYFKENPELKTRIEFTGPIYDRLELQKEYAKAKIFCLTSDWESFGIVQIEAMSQGCFTVTSDLASSRTLKALTGSVEIFECGDSSALAEKLVYAVEHIDEHDAAKEVEIIKSTYSWKNALRPVYEWIESET